MRSWVEIPPQLADFTKRGYCVVPVGSEPGLAKIRALLVKGLRSQMSGGEGLGDEEYLNTFHRFAKLDTLNAVRVKVHQEVGASEEFKRLVFEAVKSNLSGLIGPEIAMQRQVNFVTQMPNDPTALLELHTDAWAGCSPYEVIAWIPLVDVYETKSMFICNLEANKKHMRALRGGLKVASTAELLEKVRPDLEHLKMKFGSALLFSPILMHGAEVNRTQETRFILNVRFKSLFSPYGTKALGETFLPVNYLPATEVGLDYESEFGIVRG